MPVGALFRDGAGWAAFVAVDGRAPLKRLALGRMSGEAAAVETGLGAGKAVVLHPSDRIAEASRVRPRAAR